MNERNWVFATNLNFIIPESQQPDDAYLSYFKRTLFNPPEFIAWNIYGLRHLVLKKLGFKNPSLWQKLNFFECEDWKIKKYEFKSIKQSTKLLNKVIFKDFNLMPN